MRDTSFRDFVLDQLDGLPGIRSRAMFGGHGLYLEEEFFGMVWKGRLWLRTDDRSRAEYRDLGSEPIPFGDDTSMNTYWSVPEDVLEDARRLKEWVRAAALVPRKRKRSTSPSRGSGRKPRGPSPKGHGMIPVSCSTVVQQVSGQVEGPSMSKKFKPMPNREVTPQDEDRLRAFLQVPRRQTEDAIKARKRIRMKKKGQA